MDANVLSEPTRPEPAPEVVAWLRDHEADLAVDPFILGEIRYGILLLPRGRRRARLEAWFEGGVERLACIAWGEAQGRRWAELVAHLRTSGLAMPIKDSLIATTALVSGLTIVTGSVRHFEPAGVPLLDPFVMEG